MGERRVRNAKVEGSNPFASIFQSHAGGRDLRLSFHSIVCTYMTQVEKHVHSLQTARRLTLGLLEGISLADWLYQPVANGQHVLWIVAHLTKSDDWALVSLGGSRRLTFLDQYFNKALPIVSDATAYPSVEEVKALFDSAHHDFITRLSKIDESDLDRVTSGPIAEFAPNLGTLLVSHVWHEGFHCGQLAMIRRSLGLPVRWG